MKSFFKTLILVIPGALMILFFQNCSGEFNSRSDFAELTGENNSELTSSDANEPPIDPPIDPRADGGDVVAEDILPKTIGNLPMSGAFYGNSTSGLATGNSRISVQASRRFRAERTGLINAVRYNNRTLTTSNANGRCKPSDPSSRWCKCKNAGLSGGQCGYTLGNSYSVGNGGKITIEIREDNGKSSHEPVAQALGRTKTPFIPAENASNLYPTLELEKPVKLETGKIYHMVFLNSNPPTKCGLGGISISQAKKCPLDQGAMGLNGIWLGSLAANDGNVDPFRGKSHGNLIRNSTSGPWTEDRDNLSYYEVRYADNQWVGDTYTAYGSWWEGHRVIAGNNMARQKFKVTDASRAVDGLWVNHGHLASSDGSSMSAHVKDSSGRTIAKTSISASKHCIGKVKQGKSTSEKHCRQWTYGQLNNKITLTLGKTYYVEFSASSRASFVIPSSFPIVAGGFKSNNRNHWNESRAEYSSNGGKSYGNFVAKFSSERDMPLLFTIEGMPKELP